MEWKLLLLVVGCVVYVASQKNGVDRQVFTEIVSKCSRRERIALANVPLDADCRTYASCYGLVITRPSVQYCSPGTLFDAGRQICNHALLVDCAAANSRDPCNGQANGVMEDTMRGKRERAAVLLCRGGKNIGGYRCGRCNSFGSSETGCVPISGCQSTETTPDYKCNLEAVPGNPNQYVAIGPKTRDIVDCSNGTVYKADVCGCA